jgi:nucleoside-diphosphate kinase
VKAIKAKKSYIRDFKNFSTMAGNITFTMVKPSAVAKQYTGAILDKIVAGGFRIVALKLTRFTREQAEQFYGIHREKPFFGELVEYMASGPIVAAILEKENAVEAYRKYIGATNPEKADEGTIRKLYGESIQANAVHGSDSDENALLEAAYFFSTFERF